MVELSSQPFLTLLMKVYLALSCGFGDMEYIPSYNFLYINRIMIQTPSSGA